MRLLTYCKLTLFGPYQFFFSILIFVSSFFFSFFNSCKFLFYQKNVNDNDIMYQISERCHHHMSCQHNIMSVKFLTHYITFFLFFFISLYMMVSREFSFLLKNTWMHTLTSQRICHIIRICDIHASDKAQMFITNVFISRILDEYLCMKQIEFWCR